MGDPDGRPEMRFILRIGLGVDTAPPVREFARLLESAYPVRGVALSVLVHALVVALLPVASILFSPIPQVVPVRLIRYEPLRIRMPERLPMATRTAPSPVQARTARSSPAITLPAQARPSPPSAQARAGGGSPSQGSPPPPQPVEVAEQPPRQTPRRTIELPPLRPKPKAEFTLIQPDFAPDVPVQQTTPPPQLMLWSAEVNKPKRPLKEFVMPGSPPRQPERPALDAPPEIAAPNRATEVGRLRFAADATNLKPSLPVARANTMPVRRFSPPPAQAPSQSPSLDPFAGEPALAISIPERAQPFPEVVSLPGGNQMAPVRPPGAGSGVATSGASATNRAAPGGAGAGGTGASDGKSSSGGQVASRSPGTASDSGALAGTSPGGGSTRTGQAEANGNGNLAGGGAAAQAGNGARSAAGGPGGAASANNFAPHYSVPVRIEHPEKALFDIVVVGAAAAAPDAVNVLSGSPIYTVHLRVGSPRLWTLQYCIPNQRSASKVSGGVVTLSKPSPVRAPFPRVTVVPPKELHPEKDRVAVHGFIGVNGSFHGLRVLSGQQAAQQANLLSLLEVWLFRPAVRDGAPVEVEMVLLIPPLAAAPQ